MNNVGEENKQQFFIGASVGQNDKYLISKLQSYAITIEKMDMYLAKLSDNISVAYNNHPLVENGYQQQYS